MWFKRAKHVNTGKKSKIVKITFFYIKNVRSVNISPKPFQGHSLITKGPEGKGGGLEKSLNTLTLWRGSNPFLRNIFQVAILC